MKQAFSASYWAYSFGLTALATAALRMAEQGETGIVADLAFPILIIVSTVVAVLGILSQVALVRAKLSPR